MNESQSRRIGLIDVDGHNYPNIALMKLSAWHKAQGDHVEWCTNGLDPFDRVYMSKIFSFSAEPDFYPNATEIVKGGTGYCISLQNGIEVYDKEKDIVLPHEIEHSYPDYELYFDDNDLVYDEESGECLGLSEKEKRKRNTAYGFMSRGCPKGKIHKYCHVAAKEGLCSHKVADLSEFWRGQKYIELLDPNTLACKDWKDILSQLAESKAWVDFNQGVDIQLLTKEKAELLRKVKIKHIHFAWDNYEDKSVVVPAFELLKQETNWDRHKVSAYVLTNFDSTKEQDLERVYFLRSLGFQPYPMIYNKGEFFYPNGRLRPAEMLLKKFTPEQIEHARFCQKLQRWCNPFIFWKCETFDEYRGATDE
ncbi:MAG: radical SAM protein [Clostridia bacterium]|nr:radical SAM protein [Clostridia bacterium]